MVDESLAVESPRNLRFMDGGGGRLACLAGRGTAPVSLPLSSLFSVSGPLSLLVVGTIVELANGFGFEFEKACCARGDRGGVRIGLSEMGEGGTNGKDSKIESALVDVELTTDDLSRIPSISSNALLCCDSNCPSPFAPGDKVFEAGEMSFALVILFALGGERGELNAALTGVSKPVDEGGAR